MCETSFCSVTFKINQEWVSMSCKVWVSMSSKLWVGMRWVSMSSKVWDEMSYSDYDLPALL